MKKQISKRKIFVTYGAQLVLILFLVNAVIAYSLHFFVMGSSCMTRQQVTDDQRCLYIWGQQIYQKGTRSAPHQGHGCGTDITSVIPASHVGNQAFYLLPNHIADVCAATAPTSTPTPTTAPKLTNTPTPTPTKAAATPAPTIAGTTATPTTVHATSTPTTTPSPTTIATAGTTLTPTSVVTNSPTPTTASTTPTPTAVTTPSPNSVVIPLIVSLAGISDNKGYIPLHNTRSVTVSLYNKGDNVSSSYAQPVVSQTDTITFDNNPQSSTSGFFDNPLYSLGTVPAGTYQLWISVPGYAKQQLQNPADNTTLFAINGGQTISLPKLSLLAGDLDGNGVIDIADYNALIRCYGANLTTSLCTSAATADLNDDGKVDSTDYNIFLYNLRAYDALHLSTITVTPTFTPTPTTKSTIVTTTITPTKTVITKTPTVTPTQPSMSTAPTPTATPKPSLAKTIVAAFTTSAGITTVFDILLFLFLLAVVVIGIMRSKFFANLIHKNEKQAQTPQQAAPASVAQTPVQANVVPEVSGKYFVKFYKNDDADKAVWVILTDTNQQQIYGFYRGQIKEGYAHIKGTKKTASGVTYIDISELVPVAS